MSRLLAYVRRYRMRYVLGGICLLATASLAMAVPYLLKRAIDAISLPDGLAQVATFALVIIGVAVVQGIVRTWSRALIFNVGRDIEFDLRNDLFAHLQRLDASFYQRERTGDLMSRLINDVTAVRMMLGPGILNVVNTPIYYAYGLAIMLTLDVPLTLASLLPYPILLWAVKGFSRRIMERTLRVQEGLATLTSRVQENLSGLHVVRAYAVEERESAAFDASNAVFKEQSMELARVRGQLVPLMRTASTLGTLVVLWFGGARVVQGHLTVGDLVAFLGYLNLLAWPTMALGWMLSIVQRGRAAMLRLDHILQTVPALQDPADAIALHDVRGAIELAGVTFRYPNDDARAAALQDVSLSIPAGSTLALVGRTGSGKSTIASLLPRLYDVDAGSIRLDGVDIRRLRLADLRRAIGFVPQDPFLFSATVADNIRFASPRASMAEVERAARLAGVADDIASFPRGYDTEVGERGITLSGGQKQRLTLARAILADPRILILDDALSSVDARTERRILASLAELRQGRTTVVITHRVATIQDADRIAVVEDGRIVEQGSHDELLARDGVYADLFRQQSLEEELEAS